MITKKLQDFIDEPRKNYESDKTDSQDKIYVTQGYIVRTKRRLKIHNDTDITIVNIDDDNQ